MKQPIIDVRESSQLWLDANKLLAALQNSGDPRFGELLNISNMAKQQALEERIKRMSPQLREIGDLHDLYRILLAGSVDSTIPRTVIGYAETRYPGLVWLATNDEGYYHA